MATQADNLIAFPSEQVRPRRLVPLAELKALYGFSTRWWRYRIAEGLPTHKWVRGLRFDPFEVERWLDARSAVATLGTSEGAPPARSGGGRTAVTWRLDGGKA